MTGEERQTVVRLVGVHEHVTKRRTRGQGESENPGRASRAHATKTTSARRATDPATESAAESATASFQ